MHLRVLGVVAMVGLALVVVACGDNTPDWDAPDAVLNDTDLEWAKCVSRLMDGIESDGSPDAGQWLIAAGNHCTECILNHPDSGCNVHRIVERNNPLDPEDDLSDNPKPTEQSEDSD